jgi:hypothetical protein
MNERVDAVEVEIRAMAKSFQRNPALVHRAQEFMKRDQRAISHRFIQSQQDDAAPARGWKLGRKGRPPPPTAPSTPRTARPARTLYSPQAPAARVPAHPRPQAARYSRPVISDTYPPPPTAIFPILFFRQRFYAIGVGSKTHSRRSHLATSMPAGRRKVRSLCARRHNALQNAWKQRRLRPVSYSNTPARDAQLRFPSVGRSQPISDR